MNPNTPPPSDDDLPDERDLAALYARLPKDEPGPALDAAVLARAAQAVPVRRRPRWPVALASAAVLVLAAGVTWQLRDTRSDEPKSIPPAIAERMPASAPAPAPAATATGIPLLSPGVLSDDARRAEALPPAKPAARAAARKVTTEQMAPKVLRSAPVPMSAPIAAAPSPPPAPAAPPSPPSPPAPVAPAGEDATAAFSDATPASLAPHRQDLSPDDRVGEIRRLLDHGQRKEALLRLHELRLRHPQYDLPQDLRDLEP